MGAWIETLTPIKTFKKIMSHPMWVRGLKPIILLKSYLILMVAPYVGAWIETNVHGYLIIFAWSHPMWVRGLKL